MNIYPITFLFALIKYFPLFLREFIEHYWAKVLNTDSESTDHKQAKIVAHILRMKGVHITDQRLQRLYDLLPNHISIDAKERIPETLKAWDIHVSVKELIANNEAIDFTQPEETSETILSPDDLYDITTPTLIRLKNGNVAAILNIAEGMAQDKKSVMIYDSQGGVQLISFNGLANIWAGTLFDINSSQALKEPQFKQKLISEKWQNWCRSGSILFCALTLFALIQFQFSHHSGIALVVYLGITATLLAGLGLSVLLAQHSMGNINSVLARYCSTTAQNSCQKVLDNPRAKFLGISHADIGVAYFSGSLLLFITSLLTADAHPYIHAINSTLVNLSFLAIAYSLYSIYCQKKIIKQWCRLCLYTQAMVVTQALLIVLFLGFSHHTSYEHFSFILTISLLIAPGIIWYFLRAQLITKTIQKEQQHQFESIISNDATIEKILASQQQRLGSGDSFCFDDDEDLEGDIILRSDAQDDHSQTLRIVLGLSPSCEHCGSLLEEVYQFAQTQRYSIECRIRLIVGEGDSKEAIIDRLIAEHITAFVSNQSEGQTVAINALRSWYQEHNALNTKEWLSTVRNISEAESVDISVLLADSSFWVSQKDIKIIPAMYVENIHIPFISEEFSTILLRKIFAY